MRSILRRLYWLTRRRRREAELQEELRFHLEEDEQERQENGAAQDEAHWAARRELGNLATLHETTRAAWGWTKVEQFARDAAYGLRQIRRNRAFSAIAIATLALGIGGMAAIFSVFDAVLIRALPYQDADRLVVVWERLPADTKGHGAPTPPEWIDWRRLNTVFTEIGATQPGAATLSGDSEPEQVPAHKATANLWSVLGVRPAIGRAFTEEEDLNGASVLLISHGLWQRRYGGSPGVLGRKILVNDKPYEVIGVLPREFYFLPSRNIDIWLPVSFPAAMRRNSGWHNLTVVGRLKPGVTMERAQESMSALTLKVTAQHFRGPNDATLVPLREELAGTSRNALLLLLGASAALLLIACVNLANLLMSRSASRGREVAVRLAIGAGRGRLVAQFLTECLVLALLGAAAGLALAAPTLRFLERLVPETIGNARLSLDWRVLAFSIAAAIAATLLFGLMPALRGSRVAPQDGLRGGRGTAGARSHRLQHVLIVAETALAVVLLTSGGILLQTLQHLRNTDLGMRGDNLLTFEMPLFRYTDFDRRVAYVNAQLEQLRAIPGVVSAGAVSRIPLTAADQATFYLLAGQSDDEIPKQVALTRVVTRDYFATIGARLREGRFFEISDRRSKAPSALVNESFANRHFPGRSPLGFRFQLGETGDQGHWYTIIGVVKEIRDRGVSQELRPTVYRLHEQGDQTRDVPTGVILRTTVPPESIVPSVRQVVWSIDKNQPIWRVRTFQAIMDGQLSTPSQSSALLTAFAVLALLLASLGIYGVLSYAVAQRTSEIGLRMALGASAGEILLTFGRRGLALTAAGLAIGLGVSVIAERSSSSLLYGFQPDYSTTAVAVSLILFAVAAVACLVPAHRASRIDPVIALRSE